MAQLALPLPPWTAQVAFCCCWRCHPVPPWDHPAACAAHVQALLQVLSAEGTNLRKKLPAAAAPHLDAAQRALHDLSHAPNGLTYAEAAAGQAALTGILQVIWKLHGQDPCGSSIWECESSLLLCTTQECVAGLRPPEQLLAESSKQCGTFLTSQLQARLHTCSLADCSL